MINTLVVGEVVVVRRMLAGILDGAHDIRVVGELRGTDVTPELLAAYGPVVVVVLGENEEQTSTLLGQIHNADMPFVYVSRNNGSPGRSSPSCDRRCIQLVNPFGQGGHAWDVCRSELLTAVRLLDAEHLDRCEPVEERIGTGADERAVSAPAGEASTGEGKRHGMSRVLIVEDEKCLRESLSAFAVQAGYDAATASNGRDAIRMQRQRPADIVLTDIVLPGEDGLGLMIRMGEEFPATRFVVMSGAVFDSDIHLRLVKHLGASGILPKPFGKGELLEALAKAMNGNGVHHE